MKHTKTPWVLSRFGDIYEQSGEIVALTFDMDYAISNEDNARFIVHAVNSYDKLVENIKILSQIVYTQNGNLHEDINNLLKEVKELVVSAGEQS